MDIAKGFSEKIKEQQNLSGDAFNEECTNQINIIKEEHSTQIEKQRLEIEESFKN